MKIESFYPVRMRTRQEWLFLSLLLNTVLQVLARIFGQEKKINSIKIGNEEVKLSCFADMFLYIENPKDSTKNLLETITNTVKFQDIK